MVRRVAFVGLAASAVLAASLAVPGLGGVAAAQQDPSFSGATPESFSEGDPDASFSEGDPDPTSPSSELDPAPAEGQGGPGLETPDSDNGGEPNRVIDGNLVSPGDVVGNATGATGFPFADPETVAGSTQYITYGTTVRNYSACGNPGGNNVRYVPYMVTGNGNTIGLEDCAEGDAMPSGPGAWAEPGSDIWAPGVVRFNNKWILYYSASERGTGNPGHKCIGRATSNSATGPFIDAGEFSCPGGGRWAIDPDPFVHGSGLYVTFRDDAVNSFPQTGLSVVKTYSTGAAYWATRKTLLYSTDMTWEHNGTSEYTIENPSMMRISNGHWYLFFSGNAWNKRQYATGIADCGTSPLPSSRCSQTWGNTRAYFGYSPSVVNPLKTLPRNELGPGGMSLFRTIGGAARVIWHFLENDSEMYPPRHSIAGELSFSSSTGWAIS